MARIGIDARMFGSTFTGIGKYVERLLGYLATAETSHVFVVFTDPGSAAKIQAISDRFEVVPVTFPHYSFGEQLFFPHVLRQARLDLVHYPHFNAPIFSSVPSVVTIHDLILSFYPGNSISSTFRVFAYEKVLKSVTARSRAIICISRHTKKDLIELLDVPDEKISVIYNGVDREFFDPVAKEMIEQTKKKFSLDGEYLITIGNHREHKNISRLVEAFGRLVRSGYTGKLLLIGKENSRHHEVRDAIRNENLRSQVILPGFVENDEMLALLQ